MASRLYLPGLLSMINGGVNFLSSDIKAMAVDSTYTFNKTHQFVSDITGEVSGTGYARVALTSKTLASSTNLTDSYSFDSADITFPTVNTTTNWVGVILFDDTGSDLTSPLLAHYDIPELTTDGSDVILTVHVDGLVAFQAQS